MYEHLHHFLQAGWDLRYLIVVIAAVTAVVTHVVRHAEDES